MTNLNITSNENVQNENVLNVLNIVADVMKPQTVEVEEQKVEEPRELRRNEATATLTLHLHKHTLHTYTLHNSAPPHATRFRKSFLGGRYRRRLP